MILACLQEMFLTGKQFNVIYNPHLLLRYGRKCLSVSFTKTLRQMKFFITAAVLGDLWRKNILKTRHAAKQEKTKHKPSSSKPGFEPEV